jgi:adenine-specific DNA-methyltransferase
MAENTRLELTWYGKEKSIEVEPRILLVNKELSKRVEVAQDSLFDSEHSAGFENMLIHGDNLLALKALEQSYANKVKCIYIDPPYNTGSAFEQYNDNLEHSIWLSLMKPRLELLRNLLQEDGSVWISIDDDEGHYLKVLCDEVFGRINFVNTVVWEKKYAPQNDSKWLSDSHDFILVYAKNKNVWRPNLLDRGEKQNKYYKYDDNDGKGAWRSDNVLVKTFSKSGVFGITNPNTGTIYFPPEGSCYRFSQDTANRYLKENRLYFGKTGTGAPQLKRYLCEVKSGITTMTIWFREEVGDNQEAKNEVKAFNVPTIFATPKPEKLIERILTLGSSKGDVVLDSFLGSGTTAAVAQKMGRRWIGIEMGEHAYTHCKVRLDSVLDGEQGGVSISNNWKGGGGYTFYDLAPSLIKFDSFGMAVINNEYNADMLAAAMAKHEGYHYDPHKDVFWKQAFSSEKAFLFTTTNFVTADYLRQIHDQMDSDEYLIISCRAFDTNAERAYKNITLKKIPNVLLNKCEFGRDNYNLNIIDVPEIEGGEEDE